MLPRVHHTGYTVSDLDRSVAFYRLLGMEVIAEQEKKGGYLAAIVGYPDAHVRMVHLRMPGTEHVLELFEYLAPSGAGPRRIEPKDAGSPHLCFAVEDIFALADQLAEAGAETFFSPPVAIDTGVNTGGHSLYMRDPDGIPVELFQPPKR